MKVLLVEDDEYKRERVEPFLADVLPSATIQNARSVQGAVRSLLANRYVLVILDMSLPTFDRTIEDPGGRPQPLGGVELLRQMERHERSVPTIVLTQFPRFQQTSEPDSDLDLAELDRELRAEFPLLYVSAVFFDATNAWRGELKSAIEKLLDR